MTSHAPRRVLVTGGASGIGLAVAQLAVAQDAQVVLLDRDAAMLQTSVAALGPAVHALPCDVADSTAVRQAVDRAAALMGGLDTVVNAAGVDAMADIEQLDDALWERTLAVNLGGPMRVCRAAVPHLRAAGGGSIVNLSSAAGLSPLPGRSAYCASKAGLQMLGKALAMELAQWNIRVNAVCPGAVDTPLFRTSYEDAADPEAALDAIRARYALRRVAEPAEVASAVWYLCSPGASYITGVALAVDGGRSYH